MDTSRLRFCTPVQKRSILKIAIELVKADNKIHSKEISVLDDLQESLGLTQEELDLIHYAPLSEAVSVISGMDEQTVNVVMGVFDSIMRIDSDIDFEENLLYAAVTISCLPESRKWAKVLSVPDLDIDISDRQILFLEKGYSDNAHQVLDDKYDNLLISKAFGDIGLSLFYLPNIIQELGLSEKGPADKFGLLKKSMSYLMPAGDMLKVDSLRESLATFDSSTFFKVVTSRFGLEPDFFPFNAFLLVKIRGSVILDDDNAMCNTVDFLLFDYFSSESKINSEILLDREFHFTLPSLGGKSIPFESSPQSRTLYLLLLRYGRAGISQDCFNAAIKFLEKVDTSRYIDGGMFEIDAFEDDLLSGNEPWRNVIFDAIRIYRAVSTKDEENPEFLSYITSILSHRSSLKTYVNKGFSSVQDLSDKEMYFIEFDRRTNSYKVGIGLSMFLIEEGVGVPHPLSESSFWKALR